MQLFLTFCAAFHAFLIQDLPLQLPYQILFELRNLYLLQQAQYPSSIFSEYNQLLDLSD